MSLMGLIRRTRPQKRPSFEMAGNPVIIAPILKRWPLLCAYIFAFRTSGVKCTSGRRIHGAGNVSLKEYFLFPNVRIRNGNC
jgi:hypothetical protein